MILASDIITLRQIEPSQALTLSILKSQARSGENTPKSLVSNGIQLCLT